MESKHPCVPQVALWPLFGPGPCSLGPDPLTPNPALSLTEPEPEPKPDQSRTCSWAAVERVGRSGCSDPVERAP